LLVVAGVEVQEQILALLAAVGLEDY